MLKMIKVILLSIQPQYTKNIKLEIKKAELRKTIPKYFIGWVLIYETLGKTRYVNSDELWGLKYPEYYDQGLISGKGRKITQGRGAVIGRFWFNEYIELVAPRNPSGIKLNKYYPYTEESVDHTVDWEEKYIGLTNKQIYEYGQGKTIYAWRIKDLEIFDEPMELFELWKNVTFGYDVSKLVGPLERPPQSWQYVYVKEQNNGKKMG